MPKIDNTQKRLLVLYAFHKVGKKISREQIAPLLLDVTLLDWIDLQLTIKSLIQDNLLTEEKDTNKVEINLNGEQVIKICKKDLSELQKSSIKDYIKEHKNILFQENNYLANFKKVDSGYQVQLKLLENNVDMMKLELLIPTRELAEDICHEWSKNYINVYKTLLTLLSKKRT